VANLSRHVQFVELDLSSMKGAVPVELMGRTRFPPIGELPYMLTLGGHDFYWFSLEAPREVAEERRSFGADVTIACSNVDALLFGDERALLEEALPAFLTARDLASAPIASVRVVETARLTDGDSPLTYVFLRVEYVEGEPESFALPLLVVDEAPPGANVVATLSFHDASDPGGAGRTGGAVLVEATTDAAARVLLETAVRQAKYRTSEGALAGGVVPGTVVDADALGAAYVIDTDAVGASIAYGDQAVLRLLYRMEEGMAPELEIARLFQSNDAGVRSPLEGITPRVLGWVERRAGRGEPSTLAVLEELVANEGTAWQHAKSELGRMYERALAHPTDAPVPVVPSQSLLELSLLEPPPEHRESVGAYRDWAMLLGRRIGELHCALASSTDPAFEPSSYSTMDQRSKYQSARNLIGRVLAGLRRTLGELPPSARGPAGQLVAIEDKILARFEPILTQRIDAKQIRCHGDLNLGRALFTGRDFVITGLGGGRAPSLGAPPPARGDPRHRRDGALVPLRGGGGRSSRCAPRTTPAPSRGAGLAAGPRPRSSVATSTPRRTRRSSQRADALDAHRRRRLLEGVRRAPRRLAPSGHGVDPDPGDPRPPRRRTPKLSGSLRGRPSGRGVARAQNAAPAVAPTMYARALVIGIPASVYSSYENWSASSDAPSFALVKTPSRRAGPPSVARGAG
ncbi:MAG: alpha-glucosidase C-terminal domain-containing protein, partial [Labilithrix sp.]|nr:alpha-glucosidase C-terminal domain-containing protein [Labilithrix sp.]